MRYIHVENHCYICDGMGLHSIALSFSRSTFSMRWHSSCCVLSLYATIFEPLLCVQFASYDVYATRHTHIQTLASMYWGCFLLQSFTIQLFQWRSNVISLDAWSELFGSPSSLAFRCYRLNCYCVESEHTIKRLRWKLSLRLENGSVTLFNFTIGVQYSSWSQLLMTLPFKLKSRTPNLRSSNKNVQTKSI